ncbi:hypothetical protein BT96DRAFT_993445 [Gymnopus androsaceus JB14]|uniref:DNA polymerase alpha catalytic subunit N-terminal domain-containing protein n=1 Tax=Gymnopus androsaceus JB14 TaxID=1447944 RepID=A0A6A4HRK6_9AGAR|nr:hypothetical protein BT96DRAFT_993445 [Gymnopus androsaceus JB14]
MALENEVIELEDDGRREPTPAGLSIQVAAALTALKRLKQGADYKFERVFACIQPQFLLFAYDDDKIVKGRLQRHDFVEDDGVEGYADNGMDIGMAEMKHIRIQKRTFRRNKKAKDSGRSKAKAPPPPPVVPTPINQEKDFMPNLFGELDALLTKAPSVTKSRKRKTSPENDPHEPYRNRPSYPDSYRRTRASDRAFSSHRGQR